MRFVLDSSGFMNLGEIDFFGELYTTPQIVEEIRDIRTKALLEAKKIELREPSKRSLKQVVEKAKISGDFSVLSEPDMSVIALALDLNSTIVTDDYDIQNLCSIMNIPILPIKSRIKKRFKRKLYCDKCMKTRNEKICEVCGAETRPKVVKVENINNIG